MKSNTNKSTLEALLENVRFLSKDGIKKMLLVEEFTAPAIATFGMDSFSMGVPASLRS